VRILTDYLFIVAGVGVLLSILLIWQIVSITNVLPSTIFPSAYSVVLSFFSQVENGSVILAVIYTLSRLFEGYLFAAAIGIVAGISIGLNRLVNRSLDPLVQFLRPMPSVVLIPLAILYFGLVDSVIILIVTYASLWPILINTIDGVRSIDPLVIETANQLRITGLKRLRKIILPAAAPFIVSGLRVSLGIAWIVAVTAEMIGGIVSNGVGVSIFYYLNSGNLAPMYGAIIAVAIFAYFLNRILLVTQYRLMPWVARSSRMLDHEA